MFSAFDLLNDIYRTCFMITAKTSVICMYNCRHMTQQCPSSNPAFPSYPIPSHHSLLSHHIPPFPPIPSHPVLPSLSSGTSILHHIHRFIVLYYQTLIPLLTIAYQCHKEYASHNIVSFHTPHLSNHRNIIEL